LLNRSGELTSPAPVAGVPGPGRWLVFDYEPTSLFSLKMAAATSSVGKSLVTPTPYAVKMAFVDAAFCTGRGEAAAELVRTLADCEVRVGVPQRAVLTHTLIKVRQEETHTWAALYQRGRLPGVRSLSRPAAVGFRHGTDAGHYR
jgi:hypothetical protein